MTSAIHILTRCTIKDDSLTWPGYLAADEFAALRQHMERQGGRYIQPQRCFDLPPGVASQLRRQVAAAKEAARRPVGVSMELARQLVTAADIRPPMSVLVPCAGRGELALAAREAGAGKVCCITQEAGCAFNPHVTGDFLTVDPDQVMQFERCILVPSIRDDMDCRAVIHAFRFLRPAGKLLAVMLPSFQYPGGTVHRREVAELVRRHEVRPGEGILNELPPGTLEGEAAGVKTVLVGLVSP